MQLESLGYQKFLTFIHDFDFSAITAVRSTATSIEADFTNSSHHDTLKRRFNLLQDTLAQVKSGLSELNQPHVLSPLRRNARRKGASSIEDKGNFGRRSFVAITWLLASDSLKQTSAAQL